MPEALKTFIVRMRTIQVSGTNQKVLKDFRPNEANVIDYHKDRGHNLKPHCDDRQLSGKILCNLCLCGDAVMTYLEDPPKGGSPEVHRVQLPRRALQIQSGNVRYNFRHSIDASDILSPRRMSITFRQNAFQGFNM